MCVLALAPSAAAHVFRPSQDKDKVDLEQVELDDVWTLLQFVPPAFRCYPPCFGARPIIVFSWGGSLFARGGLVATARRPSPP